MIDLFEKPIRQKKIRNGIFAYQYRNGTIVIKHKKYVGYSMTEAIKLFRNQ